MFVPLSEVVSRKELVSGGVWVWVGGECGSVECAFNTIMNNTLETIMKQDCLNCGYTLSKQTLGRGEKRWGDWGWRNKEADWGEGVERESERERE